jgi:hypothetical protein
MKDLKNRMPWNDPGTLTEYEIRHFGRDLWGIERRLDRAIVNEVAFAIRSAYCSCHDYTPWLEGVAEGDDSGIAARWRYIARKAIAAYMQAIDSRQVPPAATKIDHMSTI